MTPPNKIDVRDRHGGFTIETFGRGQVAYLKQHGRYRNRKRVHGDTLWRPRAVAVDANPIGTLVGYLETSFFQLNNDVTVAWYKIAGYPHECLVWFDNKTGKRVT